MAEAAAIETLRSADGTTLAYQKTGNGHPLILVGGALNSRMTAAPLVPLLAGHFTVITFDRRGRGDSADTQPYAVERELEDLRALVDAVGGPAYLYGHSSGAILCLEAAAAGVPADRIAVYEPPYFTADGAEDHWEEFADRVRALAATGHGGEAVEAFIRHTGAPFDEAIKAEPWWPALVELAPTLYNDLMITADGVVPRTRFETIAAPVLALYGGASAPWARGSAEAVAAAVRNGRTLCVDGQSHGVAHEVIAPFLIDFFG